MSTEVEVTTAPAVKAAKKTAKKAPAAKKTAAKKTSKVAPAKKASKAVVKQVGPSKEETKTGVHTFPSADGWTNKRNGRLVSNHASKGEAVKEGRALAQKAKLEHTIHNANGKIAAKNSYGNDPVAKKG